MPSVEWAPPVKEGNALSHKHGAWSTRIVDPVARDLVQIVLDRVGYLADASYGRIATERHGQECILKYRLQ